MLKELKGKITPRTLILGIGNPLKGDDGLGPAIVKNLQGKIPCHLIDGGSAPENCLGRIRQIKPDTLVIVDAVDLKLKPGTIRLILPEKIAESTFSTHSISLKTLVDFIQSEMNPQIFIIGMQPARIAFGMGISEPVAKALTALEKELITCTSSV